MTNLELERVYHETRAGRPPADIQVYIEQLLSSQDLEQMSLLCKILRFLPSHQIIGNIDLLIAGLASDNGDVNALVLDLADRVVLSLGPATSYTLFEALIQSFSQSRPILIKYCRTLKNLEHLLEHLEALNAVQTTEEMQFTVYNWLAEVACMSDKHLDLLDDHGLLSFSEYPKNDILALLNSMELYIQLCEHEYSALYLDKKGILNKMAQLLKSSDVLVLQGAIKFWGFFAHFQAHQPTLQHLGILERLRECMIRAPTSVIVCIANIASTMAGLVVLSDEGLLLDDILKHIVAASGDEKATCYVTLAHLLDHRPCNDHDVPGPNALPELIRNASSSLDEIRDAAYAVLTCILSFDWGISLLGDQRLYSFLLERPANPLPETMRIKYTLARKIAVHPRARSFKGVLAAFEAYLSEGIFSSGLASPPAMQG